ncbi:bifunctional hydroxymethylpyrimidine kinase/phosphomethylpyrimidine kinase [Chitinibacteraceae bacterium HSL-7]
MSDTPPLVLVFSALDATSGSGVTGDAITLASLGCHPLTVATALTVQDTAALHEVEAFEPERVNAQARALMEDMSIDAIKIGLTGSVENVTTIAEILSDYPDVPVVLDAVLEHSERDDYSTDAFVEVLREMLIPHVHVLVTNARKARLLATDDPDEEDDLPLDVAAARLIDTGAEFVLITGIHEADGKVGNALFSEKGRVRVDRWDRLPGRYHGAGATLSAALTGALANGIPLSDAVRDAQDYVWQALSAAYRPGMGLLLPDRLFWARDEDDEDEPAADA